MATSSGRRLAAFASLLLLCTLPLVAADSPPAAGAGATGEAWEVTTKMSMEGLPMELPAQTSKVCAAREWTEPPAAADERQKCKNSDFRMVGTKATWKVTCANPAMTGEGEITRSSADAYTGSIKLASEEGAMTMKLAGKRVGTCELPKK